MVSSFKLSTFYIIVVLNLNVLDCLQVNVKENHDIIVEPFKTRINKREISQFFDKASYSFNGFKKIDSVPIIFPLDICIFEVENVRHAACLHFNENGVKSFVVFRANEGTYEEMFNIETPLAISMDCISFSDKGFVALAYNFSTTVDSADKGSPVFQIDSHRIKPIQYFGSLHIRSVYLRATANDLFLIKAYQSSLNSSKHLFCPYFKYTGYGFNKLGKIPCSNARRLEPFSIDSESYVAVANYADKYGRTETMSEIYKYDRDSKKLVPYQRIKTNAAVDVKYFKMPFDEIQDQHFLIFGNSHGNTQSHDKLQADSVIYKFEKGIFIPYQMLPLYSVQKFLPVMSVEAEKFILLVACDNQDIKIYNLNDWKFEESKAQFTEGALSKGVSNMRIFEEGDHSYLVIANERMLRNETNVFLPIFTQEEHANGLRQQIIEWTTEAINRLTKVDVDKLKSDVVETARSRLKQVTLEISEIPLAKVEIAYTRSLLNPSRNLTPSYWQTLSFANQAIEALEARTFKRFPFKRHTADKKSEYTHKILNVGTLVVRNKLNATKINGIDNSNIQLNTMAAPKIVVNGDFQRPPEGRSDTSPEFLDILNANHLKIAGKLNNFNWTDLQASTLKKSGQQFLKASVNLAALKADAVVTASDIVNEQNLSKLIPINGGSYVINQDVQFSKPIHAINLTINDRLNNIHVLASKLDVLLLESDDVQHIIGRKFFEDVKLLEPVTISGKIFGALDIMSPFKPIHQSINLTGHYTITGDVIVKDFLSAKNIIGESGFYSFKKVLDNGLPAFGPFDGLTMNFEQPIHANHTIVQRINGINLHQFVKTNMEEVQIIEGHKTFKDDLTILGGFAEAKTVNGVDIIQLEQAVLTKNGQQNITGNLKFEKVIANRIVSPSIRIKGKDLSRCLIKGEDQLSEGFLHVEKLKAEFATFKNLQTDGKIFESHPNQTENTTTANAEIFQNHKGTFRVENLKIHGFINENSIDDIERLLTQLNGNVKYVGGIKFHSDISVSNLTFTGKFNGIHARQFANCWLQRDTDQTFTAPQMFSTISAIKGIELAGKINEFDLEDFVADAYWINQDEHIASAQFAKSIRVETSLAASTVNGLRIPGDILLQNSPEAQILSEAVICQKDVHVKGNIRQLSTVNNVNLDVLNEFLESDLETLTVQHAVFKHAPSFLKLNSHDLKQVMDAVWLANVDVDLQHHVEIANGYFEGPLEFQGPINGVNLQYLKENYFSLSKPQQVSAQMIFTKNVLFENDFESEKLHLFGPIVEKGSGTRVDFNDLVRNSLLKGGEQTISAHWMIYEGIVAGDLDDVRVNNLNLVDDVVRLDMPIYSITAPKSVQSASIRNLYCKSKSTVNGVNLADWVYNAAFLYENYTIHGRTTIDSVTVYNNVEVLGTVNNITFDENTLLLRDKKQIIHKNVEILSGKKTPSCSFNELNTDTINGLHVKEFFTSQGVGELLSPIKGSLTFENPVYVEHFDSGEEFVDSQNMGDNLKLLNNKTGNAFAELMTVVQSIRHSYRGVKHYLSHFEHKQTIPVSAKMVISITLRLGEEFVDLIGILKEDEASDVVFYRWDFYHQQFVMDKHLSWLPRKKTLIDIFRVVFGKAEYLAIETSLDGKFYQNVVSPETEGLHEIFKSNDTSMIEALQLNGDHCFVAYKHVKGVLSVYCVEIYERGLQFVHKNDLKRGGILQIVSLETNCIAVLLTDSVEIWQPNQPEKPKQKISAVSPSQIAAVVATPSTKYIGICSRSTPKSFHHGSVEIYRSVEDSPFEHLQTIDIVSPIQVEFALLPESQDILLNILSENFDEPLAIHQYKGIVGFQPIVASSTIPPGSALSIIHLKACQQHLIAVLSKEDITLVEMVLSKT